MAKKKHVSISIPDRRIFTAIHKGRRYVYFPTTPYYLRRLCTIVKDYYEVLPLKTIELKGRTGRYVFEVEDILFKMVNGENKFKIYLGDVVEYEHIDEHAKERGKS